MCRASLMTQLVKNLPAMQEDPGSIPGLGRSTGEEKGYLLQYSGLENFMACIVSPWGGKQSAQLSDFHFHFHMYVYRYIFLYTWN